jgi:quercetin dioxygenase-like cupin family protein
VTAALLRPTPENLETAGVEQVLYEADGVTAVHYFMKRGAMLVKHVHDYAHLSILASGHVKVVTPKTTRWVVGPACLTIEAGEEHQIDALEDSHWYCVHGVDSNSIEGLAR